MQIYIAFLSYAVGGLINVQNVGIVQWFKIKIALQYSLLKGVMKFFWFVKIIR